MPEPVAPPYRTRYRLATLCVALTFFTSTTLGAILYLICRTDETTDLLWILAPDTVRAVWSTPEVLRHGLLFSVPLLVILGCHELGHFLTCRRYGVLWIYGHEGLDVQVTGDSAAYMRAEGAPLAFHFCPACGCLTHWRGQGVDGDGRRRLAVNLRLVPDPDAVAAIPIDHFDGLVTFDDLPRDGRCVRDMWF